MSGKIIKAPMLANINIHRGLLCQMCINTTMCRYSVIRATCPTKGTWGNYWSHNGGDSHYVSPFALRSGGVELQVGRPRCYAGGKFDKDNGARCGKCTNHFGDMEDGNKLPIIWLRCLPSQTLPTPHTNSFPNVKHTQTSINRHYKLLLI